MYHIQDVDSTLIKEILYEPESRELTIVFRKYYTDRLTYQNVPFNYFEEISCPTGKSYGQFYLQMIKPKFKLKQTNMSENKKPVTVNYEQGGKRYIRMSIDMNKINRDLLVQGEKGVYLQVTLQMKGNGEVDKFGNLGMITQDVPAAIYQKEKHLPVGQRTQGPILGNGAEFERRAPEGMPGDTSGTVMSDLPDEEKQKAFDDLPF